MTQFQYLNEGNSEAQDKLAEAYLFVQSSEGIAAKGVLSGLVVSPETTASKKVVVGAGACIVQPSRLNGADRLINDTDFAFDVLTANPVGGLPRNDLVVFDQATLPNGIRVVVGTPNAVPSDPAVPATAVPLARLRHAASATTIPASAIEDVRVFTYLNQSKPDSGWKDLPIQVGGWTAPSGVRWQCRRLGEKVEFRGTLANAAFTGTGFTVVATIPSGIPLPAARTALTVASNTPASRSVFAETDGTIQVYSSAGSAAWFTIGGSYAIG